MSKPEPRSPYRTDASAEPSLAERVRDRVSHAEERFADIPVDANTTTHTLALWQVFDEFGDARREQRRRTRAPAIPGLRDATRAFRREPSFDSLVAVAAFLDDQVLLQKSS
jgi:hypothetical protein